MEKIFRSFDPVDEPVGTMQTPSGDIQMLSGDKEALRGHFADTLGGTGGRGLGLN